MRTAFENALNRVWYGDAQPGIILRTLERIYASRIRARQDAEYAKRARDLEGKPIVVVGNLTAGGTGKTPLLIHLCDILTTAGLKPGVISRGYGREGDTKVQVKPDTPVSLAGDEPLLIARRAQVPVLVDNDREAAAKAMFEHGVDVVIADDGLQRLRLPRAMEICVIDSERVFGNGHLLPAGPLREPVNRLDTVDDIVSNGGAPSRDISRPFVPMQLEPGPFRQLDGQATMGGAEMAQYCRAGSTVAVAGIGHPRRFFDTLIGLGVLVAMEQEFPDHHVYRQGDFADKEGTILMTEKDAMKCSGLGLTDAWYLPVNAELPEPWEREFVARVKDMIYKEDSSL